MIRRIARLVGFSTAVLLAAIAAAWSAPDQAGSASPRSRETPSRARAAAAGLFRGPLQTALVDVEPFLGPEASAAFARVRGAGATAVRIIVFWDQVAPEGRTRPEGFDPADPNDPRYRWAPFDRQLGLAVLNGLEPIVGIQSAPRWAEAGGPGAPGTRRPSTTEFAAFATAAATRYSGRFAGLPRVRYWQAWNEPNLTLYLNPPSTDLYRALVNAFADAVHAVDQANVVIAGGTSPFGFENVAIGPLRFMRDLLCVSAGSRPRRTCSDRIRFDIWAHHPYTSGGPTHKAQRPDDVSLGDLPEMRRVLDAAIRDGTIVSKRTIRFWITEFSWDSKPPDPTAVPERLHARWVAEALYRMWQSGVSLVTWFQLRDAPLRASEFQSGLYHDSADGGFTRPKLALRAFRFPFVAFRSSARVVVWGRTPGGRPARVAVERAVGTGWRRLASISTNRYGIFSVRVRAGTSSAFRARLANSRDASVPFSLTRPPDLEVWPFGCGGILPCT